MSKQQTKDVIIPYLGSYHSTSKEMTSLSLSMLSLKQPFTVWYNLCFLADIIAPNTFLETELSSLLI